MKRITLILVLIFSIQQGFSYTWESYGPEGIKAENLILLNSSHAHSLICTDSGMYLNTSLGIPNWEFFAIPSKDATLLNNDTLIIIGGSGSYSDGIFGLDLQTYEYSLIDYCFKPNFIMYYEPDDVYFLGHEYGLSKSVDGLNWSEVSFFEGKKCVEMEHNYFQGNLIVNVSADISHLYLSNNGGTDWTEASNSPGWVTEMAFYSIEEVYCIFPDNSYSSGLWYSGDYGDNWENAFYSTNMNTICNVSYSDKLLLGWKNIEKDDEGVAVYDPDAPPPGLTFLNEGLPNTNINKIVYEGLLGGAIIFVCTDNGVYLCQDYFVGVDEHPSQNSTIDIFPNPVTKQTTIKLNLREINGTDNSISIYNNQGKTVDEIKIGTNPEIIWDRGSLPSGVYYMVVKNKKEKLTRKFVIL